MNVTDVANRMFRTKTSKNRLNGFCLQAWRKVSAARVRNRLNQQRFNEFEQWLSSVLFNLNKP